MAQNEDREPRPVAGENEPAVPREHPYRAGGKQQGELSGRKASLLNTGTVGRVPGRADSEKLAAMHVQDAHPYQRRYMPGVAQTGPRPLPREREAYRTPAPGGTGSYVRYYDGHTELHRERPELVDYHNSLDPSDPDDADERESVRQEISDRDSLWGHHYW